MKSVLESNLDIVTGLASLGDCVVAGRRPEGRAVSDVVSGVEIVMPVENLVDLDREISRLGKDLEEVSSQLERTEAKLENRNFIDRAPEEVVEKERGKLEEFRTRKGRSLRGF